MSHCDGTSERRWGRGVVRCTCTFKHKEPKRIKNNYCTSTRHCTFSKVCSFGPQPMHNVQSLSCTCIRLSAQCYVLEVCEHPGTCVYSPFHLPRIPARCITALSMSGRNQENKLHVMSLTLCALLRADKVSFNNS